MRKNGAISTSSSIAAPVGGTSYTRSPPPPPAYDSYGTPQYGTASGAATPPQTLTPVTSSSNLMRASVGADQSAPLLTTPVIPGHNALTTLAIRTLPKMLAGNLIIVGDIHGCLQQFEALLRKVNFRHGIDCLVLVGDLVNKGPESIGVVKRAIELNAFAVLGNHDYTLLKLVQDFREGRLTPEQIEEDPVAECARDMPDDCVRYLMGLPHIIKVPQYNLLIVHAGVDVQEKNLHSQKIWNLLHVRRVLRDGTPVEKGDEGSLWARLWEGPETIVFGHDARTGFQEEEHAIGIDTACVYGKALTAVIYPGKRFESVPGLPLDQLPKQYRKRRAVATSPSQEAGLLTATPAGVLPPLSPAAAFPATPAAPPMPASSSSSGYGLHFGNGKVLTPGGAVVPASGASFPGAPSPPPKQPESSGSITLPVPRSKGASASAQSPTTSAAGETGKKARTAAATKSGSRAADTGSPPPDAAGAPSTPPQPHEQQQQQHRRHHHSTASNRESAVHADPSANTSEYLDLLRATRRDAIEALIKAKAIVPLIALLEAPSFEEHWVEIVEDLATRRETWVDFVLLMIRECVAAGVKPSMCLGLAQDVLHAREDVRAAVQAEGLEALDLVERNSNGIIPRTVLRQTLVALRPPASSGA